MKIPNEHQAVMPYIIVDEADELIRFIERVFNAKTALKLMRDDQKTVMHAEIRLKNTTIMCAGTTAQWDQQTAGMFVYVDSADEAYHKALALNAVSIMELTDLEYGRSCGVKDPFGNVWWITSL